MIKVQIDELRTEAGTLQKAIEDFKPYSQDFILNSVDRFEEFNSDFIDKIKETLNNMTDTKAPELIEKVQEFHDRLVSFVEELDNLDRTIAEQIDSNTKEE